MRLGVFRLFAVVLLTAIVVVFVARNPEDLETLRRITPVSIGMIACLTAVITVLYAHSMFVYLRGLLPVPIRATEWQGLVFASRLLNYLLPQGANVYRAAYLKKRHALPFAAYLGIVLFHSWIFATLTLWTSALAMPLVDAPPGVAVSALLLAISASAVAPLLYFLPSTSPDRPAGASRTWVYARLETLAGSLRAQSRSPRATFTLAAIVAVTFSMTCFCVYLLLGELAGEASLPIAVFLSVIFTISRFLNLLPGNVGLTEIIAGAAFEFLGGTLVLGILISAVLRIIEFGVAVAMGGLAILLTDHRVSDASPDSG